MLDRYIVPKIKQPLHEVATVLHATHVRADTVTVIGFVLGVLCVLAIASGYFVTAFVLLCLNRIADGIDGELARLTGGTDAGAFLDIVLDFIFYAIFPLGFALYNPGENAVWAALLIASFVGTGASFLAFDTFARQQSISHPDFGYKGFYYLNGLAEGTETIFVFALMCWLPHHFALIAGVFAAVCVLTAINRVTFGYLTLRGRKR